MFSYFKIGGYLFFSTSIVFVSGGGAWLLSTNNNRISDTSFPNEDMNDNDLNSTNIHQEISYTSDDLISNQSYSKVLASIKQQEQKTQDLIAKTINQEEIKDLNARIVDIKKIQKHITQQKNTLDQLSNTYQESWKNLIQWLKMPPVYSYIQTVHTYYGNETNKSWKFTWDDIDFLRLYREDNIMYKAPLYGIFKQSEMLFTDNQPNKQKRSLWLLKSEARLKEINYSQAYKGYKMFFCGWTADFMVHNHYPTHLQELKKRMQSVINASNTIRSHRVTMNDYITDNNNVVDDDTIGEEYLNH